MSLSFPVTGGEIAHLALEHLASTSSVQREGGLPMTCCDPKAWRCHDGCTCVECACGHCLHDHEKWRWHRLCRVCTPLAAADEVPNEIDRRQYRGNYRWDRRPIPDWGGELDRHRPAGEPPMHCHAAESRRIQRMNRSVLWWLLHRTITRARWIPLAIRKRFRLRRVGDK